MEKREVKVIDIDNSFVDKLVALYFSLFFLALSIILELFIDDKNEIVNALFKIMSSPSPLVSDYFELGVLASSFLSPGLC